MAHHRSDLPEPQHTGGTPPVTVGSGPTGASSSAEVIRSEERLVAGVERHVTGSVRVSKRVVTEERTVTVTVRREELVVEHLPAGAATVDAEPAADRDGHRPVITLTLSEEQPEVSVRVVPRERVRVFVDRITTDHAVTDSVAREVVEQDVVETRSAGERDVVETRTTGTGTGPLARRH